MADELSAEDASDEFVKNEWPMASTETLAFAARLQSFHYNESTNAGTITDPTGKNYSSSLQTTTSMRKQTALKNSTSDVRIRDIKSEKSDSRISNRWSRKRNIAVGDSMIVSQSPTPVKKRRTTTKERAARDPYSPNNNLVDSIRPGLLLIFVGLNPGLETARTGHAYAHFTNQFWPLLYKSGITPFQHKPEDTHALMDLYSIGNTNLCSRPTRSGDGLTKQEQVEGVEIVEEKIKLCKPEVVCIVGKGIWDIFYYRKAGKTLKRTDFNYGWQDEQYWIGRTLDSEGVVLWQGAKTFVSTSTSGLAADTKPAEKLAIMKCLGDWINARRKECASPQIEVAKAATPREGRKDVEGS